jgi:hypothetical protein
MVTKTGSSSLRKCLKRYRQITEHLVYVPLRSTEASCTENKTFPDEFNFQMCTLLRRIYLYLFVYGLFSTASNTRFVYLIFVP